MIQKYIAIATGQLDYLDPILGMDLQFICSTMDSGMLTTLYNECLARANVWPHGATIRLAWCNVLDCLTEIGRAYAPN